LAAKNGRQLPSLVQQATSTRKVQSTTTRSNINRIFLACYPLPRHQDVRREVFAFVDAAQNVAQSRVLGYGEWLAGAALETRSSSGLKITYQGQAFPRMRTF
jgi:hypothetical protein